MEKPLDVHLATCSAGTRKRSQTVGRMLEEKALQLLCCMKLQRKTLRGNLCCCLFVFTLWENKLSGNWSDLIRATLRTRPAVQGWLSVCVGSGGARSHSHKLISSRVVVATRLKILTPNMLFYLQTGGQNQNQQQLSVLYRSCPTFRILVQDSVFCV